ncbi:MAG: MBL fold metallo-hydrolase [Bacteroidia bacterium]|nr:MBL fold metallo-hydrolase [Bacteroidia bacterium]
MKTITEKSIVILLFSLLIPACSLSQKKTKEKDPESRILSLVQLEQLMTQPKCLVGYRSNQTGPLSRIDAKEGEKDDSTFTVEKIKIPSDGAMINGWLYLPLGSGKFPLIVLTNGGGDGRRQIKSLSDWIAPVLAHCGYAAFVHDKRGTGESEGSFVASTYEDFIRDAGNCAIYLSKHNRINPDMVGIMGGSEGGIIAVSAACRYPEIKFVISQAGTVVSGVDDRLNAQLNGMLDRQALNDSLLKLVKPLWIRSFQAWASHDPEEHQKVDTMISDWRKKYDRNLLPFMKSEMETIPGFSEVLPTWNSMGFDYLTELTKFTKPWLAIFGEVDRVVPTQASVRNIEHFMNQSGSKDCEIAVIPKCGHAPVNIETKRMIRIDHLLLNWLNQNVSPMKCVQRCTVTYIANEGFLIETANHKILVDALFGNIQGNWCDQPGDSVINLMLKGLPPFDGIDAVLVTHKHSDHFNESLAVDFLINNKKSVLICPDQVNELLKRNVGFLNVSDRIHSFKSDTLFDTSLSVNDINIRALRFKHGSWFEKDSASGKTIDLHHDIENLGYLVEADGFRLFHTGDCNTGNLSQFTKYKLFNQDFDVAFFDRVFLRREGMNLINNFSSIKNLILMHVEPGRRDYYQSVIKEIPGFYIFSKPYDKKILSK